MIRLTYTRSPALRVATSPAWELVGYARAILRGSHPVVPAERLATWRRQLDDVRLDTLLAALSHPQYVPSFLVPLSVAAFGSIAGDLLRVGRTDPEETRHGIEPVLAHLPEESDPARVLARGMDEPMAFRDRIVEQMRVLWDVVVAPGWDAHAAMLERDVLTRGRTLALHGARRVLDEIHDDARWDGEDVVVSCDAIDLSAAGTPELLLVPSVFVWPKVFVDPGERGSSVLYYPARGAAMLFPERSPSEDSVESAALDGLLGRSRARLLRALGEASTTTELASRFALSAGGVSQHLGRLDTMGLVRRTRVGRRVYYERSPRGEDLVGLFDDGAS